jgi:uncharacterized protein
VARTGLAATPLAERIVWLDVLRGAALFGIAQINFPSFASGALPITALYAAHASLQLQLLAAFLLFFVSAKFYPIFAFLFGYGHFLQRRRLERQGIEPGPVLFRRYLALFALGVVHGSCFFFGDILTIYGLAGGVLLLSNRTGQGDSKTQVLTWAGLAGVMAIVSLALEPPAPANVHQSWVEMLNQEVAQIRGGHLIDALTARAQLYLVMQFQEITTFLPQVLMFMSAGIWASERGVLQHPERHRELFKRCIAIGLLVGVPVNLALVAAELEIVNQLAAPLALAEALDDTAFFLSLVYLGALGLYIAGRPEPNRLAQCLAAMGRLALSNYLVQSLVMMLLWYWTGPGIDGKGVVPAMAILALLVCLVQALVSVHWLKHYRQGPMEALWRRFTYARVTGRVTEKL